MRRRSSPDRDNEFIASHPMAGRETIGVRNSDEKIFRGANFIINPTEKNTQPAIDAVHELAEILGFGRISILTPREHDEMIGFLSQLTHVIAISLMNCQDNTHLAAYTGDSFRDLTRIARINDKLWSELFLLNRDILELEIGSIVSELNAVKGLLQAGDREGLREKNASVHASPRGALTGISRAVWQNDSSSKKKSNGFARCEGRPAHLSGLRFGVLRVRVDVCGKRSAIWVATPRSP